MRLLVFSDIHGNVYALEKLVEVIQKETFDKIAFLGDIFGYYYHQEECIELLNSIPNLVWLQGNHDAYAMDVFWGRRNASELIENYGHSYDRLTSRFNDETMKMMSMRPSRVDIEVEGKHIGLFHGRPNDYLEGRIYNDTALDTDEFKGFDVVFVGHTHCKIDRKVGGTRLLSPGSLGQPRDRKGYGFLVYDTCSERCEFRNVEVDNGQLRIDIDYNDFELKKLYDVLEREE